MNLFKKIPCQGCGGKRVAYECGRCHGSGEEFKAVNPADLDLAALGVLEELRAYLNRGKKYYDGTDQMSNPEKSSIYELVLRHIADLESTADLKVNETLVQAGAWDLLRTNHEAGIQLKRKGKRPFSPTETEEHCYQLIEDMKESLAQARAELDTSRTDVREKGDKSHE